MSNNKTNKTSSRIYCCVNGCGNTRKGTKCSLFKLPVNRERRNEWLKKIGREDLLRKTDIKPGSYEVCSMHFEDNMISEHLIRKLLPNALPTLRKKDEFAISTPTTFSFDNADSKGFDIGTQTDISWTIAAANKTPGTANDAYDSGIGEYSISRAPIIIESQNDLCELELNTKSLNNEDTPNTVEGDDKITERFTTLTKWQSSVRNKNKPLDSGYKHFALTLRLSNPTTYQTMKAMLDLPSDNTLARFKLNIRPEIESRIFTAISLKLESLPGVARYCTMCIGRMFVKRHVYYNIRRDEIIGFHNVNGSVRNEVASTAYVLVLRGIAVNWTQPIAYALLGSIKQYEELEHWIMEVLVNLSKVDIKVMAVVTEPRSNFNKFAKEVMGVTTEKPYFIFDGRKVYYIFDVPYMFTSLRHDLMNNQLFLEGNNISWHHIKEVYYEQKEKKLHLLPKITDDHIDLNKNQERHVKYAAQTFSRNVYGALNMFIYNGFLPTQAKMTAEFVKSMNDLFDVLNSNVIMADNNIQRAFTGDTDQLAILNEAHKMFGDITAINHDTGHKTKLETFENIRTTIAAITMLSKDLKMVGINFILTRRLNLDTLESFFDTIKQEENWRIPTPIRFIRTFSKLALREMLKVPRTTKSKGGVLDLLSKHNKATKTVEDPLKAGNTMVSLFPKPANSMVSLGEVIDYNFELPAFKALTIVAEYLLQKCAAKHRCSKLSTYLRTAQFGIVSIGLSSYFPSNIQEPPETFMTYVKELETTIARHFDELLMDKPANSMLAKLKCISFTPPCTCFPKDYLLKLYVRFRVYSILKYNNRCFKSRVKRLKYSQLS